MIDVKELRIGNLFIVGGTTYEVEPSTFLLIKNDESYLNFLKPIKLTKDEFIKLGAIEDENGDYYIEYDKESDLRFYIVEGKIQITKCYYCPIENFIHINTVHLFQNLYFTLTGKELEYKQQILKD